MKFSLSLLRNVLHRLSHSQLLMVCSVVVGLWSGVMAVALKFLAHSIQQAIVNSSLGPLFYSIFPLAGILLTVTVTTLFFRKKLEKGTFEVLYAIARKSSRIPRQQTYSHVVTSAITVGLGGSAGLESPIVQTGSAIGSTFGSLIQLSHKDRSLLIGCGAAAGIAAAFNAPIAGVLFALEVLLAQASVGAFIPIIMAGATGALCSKVLVKDDILLSFSLQQPFDYHNTLYYVLLGILCGLYSAYYTRSYVKGETILNSIESPWMKALVGGFSLGALVLVLPPLFGEGYSSIRTMAELDPYSLFSSSLGTRFITTPFVLILFLVVLLLAKVWATVLTLGSGGNGGNFAPSLFAGALLGFTFVFTLNQLKVIQAPAANFTLVGMCGVLTGIFHAPLTGIFLIAEITGGYELIIPLMIVASISLSVSRYTQPKSLDAIKLAQKGHEHSHDQDTHLLNTMPFDALIETDFSLLYKEEKLGDLIKRISQSRRNIFPVVDREQRLLGIILLDDVREKIFQTDLYSVLSVEELMQPPPATIDLEEKMVSVMEKFDRTRAWNLPVLSGKYYRGFVSKSKILTEYRKRLQEQSLDF